MSRIMVSGGLRRALLVALATLSFWWLVLADSRLWFGAFPGVTDPVDFSIYYAAARVGLEHGWSHIYDYGLQAQQFGALHTVGDQFNWASFYITPPPMAWLVFPFALLPHALAYYLWVTLLGASYLVTGYLAVPGGRLPRVTVVLFGATTFPVLQPLADGQAAFLVALAMVAAWALLLRGHSLLAGLAMAPLLLKPQTAYLVPLGLLVWGEWKAVASLAVVSVVVAGIALISIGPEGLAHWRALLAEEPKHLANQVWTPASLVGVGPQAYAAEAAAALVTVAVGWLSRGDRLPLVFAAGLAGSLLAAPYHQASDSIVLVAAFWLYLRLDPPGWHWLWLAFGALAALFEPPWGPRPLLLFAAGWLLLMLWLAARQAQPGSRIQANPA